MIFVNPGVLEDISLPLERFLSPRKILSVDEGPYTRAIVMTHLLRHSTLNNHRSYSPHPLQDFRINVSTLDLFELYSWYNLQGQQYGAGTLASLGIVPECKVNTRRLTSGPVAAISLVATLSSSRTSRQDWSILSLQSCFLSSAKRGSRTTV